MTALLSADAVVAGYPGRADVLHGATVALHPGTRTAVLGANGSGKTTLLRCLAGAHRPSAGHVRYRGTALSPGRSTLRAHRRRVDATVLAEQALHQLCLGRRRLHFAGKNTCGDRARPE